MVDIGNLYTRSLHVDVEGEQISIISSGEAPTTVGPPEMDVTEGVIASVEKMAGVELVDGASPSGSHVFLFSSDASGGLHMAVTGLIGMISSDSAQRAALGAGALLIDQFSKDDGRPHYMKVASMRYMKPDILLMAGGTDGGAIDQVLEMAGIVKEADVKPRFGSGYPLPVIFAGNVELQERVEDLLRNGFATKMVDNVRPVIDEENLGPARESIYDAYMEHVLVHSPGFSKISEWTKSRILPSQAAVGKMLYAYAEEKNINLIGVDVGGDTTDVYSVFDGVFNRSLNADIGLTFGLSNILKISGIDNILRWLPNLDERATRNTIGNMMIRPPDHLNAEQRQVQSALAKEAIILGLEKHREIATRLKGSLLDRTISDMFEQAIVNTRIDLMRTDQIIGKGRIFKDQSVEDAVHTLLDSTQPEGFTELALDLEGYSPHLGNLLAHNEKAALDLFESTLSMIGTSITPVGKRKPGSDSIRIAFETGKREEVTIGAGELNIIPLRNQDIEASFTPIQMDLGRGRNKSIKRTVRGGNLGLVIDTRGRPVTGGGKPLGLMSIDTGGGKK